MYILLGCLELGSGIGVCSYTLAWLAVVFSSSDLTAKQKRLSAFPEWLQAVYCGPC